MSVPAADEPTLGSAEVRAFIHTIARHTVALLPPDGTHVGTGTVVRWKALRLILTANHNLQGTRPSAVRFVFYPGGTLREGPMGSSQDKTKLSAGVLLPVEDAVCDLENDIAVVPLNMDRLPETGEFYDINPRPPIIREANTIMLAGFAWDNSVPLRGQARAVGVTTQTGRFDTTLNSRRDLSSKYDPDGHFLLPYTRIADGIRPGGMSGAAAWCNADPSGTVWAPRPVLAGVLIAWFEKSKLLQIVKMERILALLDRI